MATLTDRYVQTLVKYNDALTEQRQKDVQKQYNEWERRQRALQTPAVQTPVIQEEPTVQEIPVLKFTAPFANDEAAQKAERAQQINNDFAGISNYINNAKAQKRQAAERQARKEEQTQQAQQQLFNNIEEYSKTYQKPTSNDQITMNADGTVDVASVKRDARKKAAQSNAKTETQLKEKTRLVMNDNGLPDMLAMKPEIGNIPGQTLINNAMNGDKASRTVPELAKLGASPALKNAQNYTKAVVEYEKALENADARTKLQYYAQKWLDPAYSMTDQDKKQYEGLVKQWKKENPEGAKAWENNFDGEQYHWDFLNEYPEVRDLLDIKYKNDPVAAFANGLNSAFDFPWMVGTGIAKLFSDEEGDAKIDERSARRQQRIANAQSQNKVASTAGNLYGQAMWYALLDLAGGAAGIGGSGAAAGSTGFGSKLIPFLKEQGLQLAGDTVVQTAPVVARDIYNKEDFGTIAKDAGIDIGINAATNLLMGAGGELLKKYSAGKAANTVNQIQDVKPADEIAAETAKIESLKNGENTISTAQAARLAEEANATMDQNTVLANALEDLRIRDARNASLAEKAAAQPINYRETLAKALEERPVSDAVRRTGNVTSDTAERAARNIAEEINESKVSALGRNPVTGELSNYGNAIMRRLNELNGLSEARTAALNADPALKEAFGNAWTKYQTEFTKADAGQVNALKAATNELADVYESIGKVTGENANARRNLEDVYDILMHRNIPRKFEGDMPENINPILDMLDEQSRSNVENSLDTVRNYIDDTIYKNMRAIRGNETLQAKAKDVTDAYDKWIDAVYSGIGDTERLGKDVRNAMLRANRAFEGAGISAFKVPQKMAKQTNLPDMILKNNTPEGYVPPVDRTKYGRDDFIRELAGEDSYALRPEYKQNIEKVGDLLKREEELGRKISELRNEMAKEIRVDPELGREYSWMFDDNYTKRGLELKDAIEKLEGERRELNAAREEIETSIRNLDAENRALQASSFNNEIPSIATKGSYDGFSIDTTGNRNIDKMIAEGRAYVAEMSPEEYLRRSSQQIYDKGSLESAIRGTSDANIQKYAAEMRNGAEYDMPYLDLARGEQEGRHRALAALVNEYDSIPVAVVPKSVDDIPAKTIGEDIRPDAEMTIRLDSTKPKAENTVEPAKSVTEPVQPNQPNMKTRKTYSNTMQKSDVFPEKELAENPYYAKEEFGYLEQHESESLAKASNTVATDKEGLRNRFGKEVIEPEKARQVEASDIDSIYMLIRENNEEIKNAADEAEIARLRQENGILTHNLARINTNAGRVVQANGKWSRTPEGMKIQADAFKKGKVDEILKEADWHGDVTKLEDNIVKRIDELIDSKMWDDLKASDGIDSEKGLNLIRDELVREINNAAAKAKKNISNTDVDNLAKKIQQKLLASPDIDKIEDQLMSDDIWQMVAGVGDITEEHMDEALKLLDEAKQFNPNSKDAAQRIDAAYLILANDIGHGKSFMDKLDAWRYFAMLSKPTTHLRNMLGNTSFGLVTGAENSLSAVLEAGLDRASKIARHGKGIDRTKSLLGPQDVDLIKACARDFNDNAYGLYKGNKYYDDLAAGIEKMVKTFDDKGAGKAANFLTETNTALLDAEDVLFGKSKYATSLAGYLKANGYGTDALKSEDTAIKRVVEDARAYALSKANEATFHNNSAFAKLTTEIDRGLREWSRLDWGNGNSVKKAVGLAGRHIVPFAKTPANILSSILSRGPQESGKVLYDLVQLAKHNPDVKAKDLIEDISKTASGTMILGLGAYLYSTGHIELGGETDNERFNKKSRGITGPSLKFGNTYVALNDGNVPTAILAMGANLAQAYKGKKGGLDAFLDGLASVSDTVVDTTMLSGLADVLNSARYSKDNADLASRIGMQVITNAAGQYIPNLTRGLENVVDSEKRNTAYTGQTGVMDTAGKSLQYASTGIPFLQESARAAKNSGIPILEDIGNVVALNPQVDRWGNDIEKVGGNALGRLANNMINPTSITTDQSNALDKEIDRLYARLTDNTNGEPIMSVDEAKKLFTYTPNAESKFDGEPLSRDDWYKYQKERGKSRYDLMKAVVNSRYYRYLTDEEKATMLKEMDDISKNYTREKYGAEIKNKKMAKLVDAYKEGGAKAVLDIKGENIDTTRTPETRMKEYQKAQTEEQKFEAVSDDIMGTLQKAGVVDKYAESVPQEAREAYAEYGMQGVEDYATVKSNKKGASYSKYTALKSEIPSLTAKEYTDIYNNFSVPDENGKYDDYFKKEIELIPYLTSRTWDNDEQLNIYAHALSPKTEGTWYIKNNRLYYNMPSVEKWRDNGKAYSAETQARVNNVVSLFKK